MADTALQVVVSPLLGVLFDNLSSLIQSEVSLVWGVKKQMVKLSRTLSTIKGVLDDAEEKQLTDKAIRNWLRELKDAAYDADDVLDECGFQGLELASEMKNNGGTKQVINFVKQFKIRSKIGKRIKELRQRFNEIADEKSKFHLQEGIPVKTVEFFLDRETSSMLTEPQVFGRNEDKENLVRLLLNSMTNQEDISICPILGIGGIGKTTLAQLIYNDGRIADYFEVRSWVCVSDDFDSKRLIRAILVSLTGTSCDLEELDPLQRRLQDEVRGKRLLLVLDDVWTESQNDWNKLKGSLGCVAKGSSVVVTTRLETVASITATVPAYSLNVLSENDCWSLFKQRAFGVGNEERPVLEQIGREIVKKCGGLPLAAKALGGLMRFKSEEKEWLFVRDSQIWDLPQSNDNNILPALRLSYNHLPSHLRQCFAYCSMFPKGYDFPKEKLILLWMANGLVQYKETKELEEAGNDIFKGLLLRSFFQDMKRDGDGNITNCKMHDLVHDLASHVAEHECSGMDIRKVKNITRRTRHLSLISNRQLSSPLLQSISESSPCLRSLILLKFDSSIKNLEFIFSKLARLRALDLSGRSVTELPESIGEMKHLRYLNISHALITSLPESLCRLKNLQTLILKQCLAIVMLPNDMRKLSNLRHLDVKGCTNLSKMPKGLGKLNFLCTLSIFVLGFESGCGIKELQRLNLGGELQIKCLERLKHSIDATEANLIGKENLRSLGLSWSHSSHMQENQFEVLTGLQPHSNLMQLNVEAYEGVKFPSWLIASSLPNLVEISLKGCERCQYLPALGKLPLLKVLKLISMVSVKFIIDSESNVGDGVIGFPSLEELELRGLPNLERWSSFQGSEGALLPRLKRVSITRCPKLTAIPMTPSLEVHSMRKCNNMELQSLQNLSHLSSVRIREFNVLESFPQGMLRNLTSLDDLQLRECYSLKTLPVELETLVTLKKMVISRCTALPSLPEGLRNLSSLRSLTIGGCINLNLKCLPELETRSLRYLSISDFKSLISMTDLLRRHTGLQSLSIENCPELTFSIEDFQHLVVLGDLTLVRIPKLRYLPEGIKHVARLRYLCIEDCSNLAELPAWISNLTSLQTLFIHDCKNLKVLPEAIQNLTALRWLRIIGCDPDLERRCQKGKGKDWYKVSHVAFVRIGSEIVNQITQ